MACPHNLSRTRLQTVRAFGAVVAVLAGCAAPSDDHANGAGRGAEAHDETKEIRARVAALGFSTDDIAFVGDYVRVEGDIILLRDALLNDLYEPTDADLDESSNKGYRHSNLLANYTNIKLKKITASNPGTTIWNAAIAAANDFNAVAPSLLSISTGNTGPAIAIYEVPAADWPSTPCDPSWASCALYPLANGTPSPVIYVKASQIGPSCPAWTAAGLANRLRHELGHAVGLRHPGEGTHIPGTALCLQGNPANCPNAPLYSTVMTQTAACNPVISTLQTDDRASVQALYP